MAAADWKSHPNVAIADEFFPRLSRCLKDAENLLKNLRSKRNRGLATDRDVEDARQARDCLRNILLTGNWIED